MGWNRHQLATKRRIRKQEWLLVFTQFWRFLVAGIVNATAGFLLFLFFFGILRWHYLLSHFMVFVSWAWFGFQLQKGWAFRAGASGGSLLRYLLNQIVFIVLATLLFWMLVEFGALREEVAYLVTIGLATIGIFFSSRLWVFARFSSNHQAANRS